MAFTEFYCQSGGSNVNAGSTTSNTAAYTSTNGNWNQSTAVFIPTDGSTPASSVNVGDFMSVYLDGATATVSILRVATVAAGVNGAITASLVSGFAGASPTTLATGRTLKTGGAWKGPSGTNLIPFSLAGLNGLINAGGDPCRINMKNDATYSITTGITTSGGVNVFGYSSSPGDGSKAIIDFGTTTGNAFTVGSTGTIIADIVVQSSATTGTGNGFHTGVASNVFLRCVANNMRGNGFYLGNSNNTAIECEAYSCNKSNTAGNAGFVLSSNCTFIYCISHDNIGSNTDGFTTITNITVPIFSNCIADSNGRHGFGILGTPSSLYLNQCDSYNNGGDGFKLLNTIDTNFARIQNCNFIKNTGYGVNSALTTGRWFGTMDNCGFGSGTAANGTGQTNKTDNLAINGSITYPANALPWADGPNGDFRINLKQANFAGRGAFTETAAGYAGAVGYSDIGACQSLTGAGGTFSKEVSYGMAG